MSLPGAPDIVERDGELFVEGIAAVDLGRRFGTPLYVYSSAAMARALAAYQRALAGRDHLLCYAIKANSTLAILQWFAARGCGFDIVSGGELERVLAAGADPTRIVFSGVGKTRSEMARALAHDVLCFNVESIGELELLSEVAVAAGRSARVSLRVNPDVDPKTHPYISTGLRASKFGIAHHEAHAAFRRAARLPGLEVVGIDCHIGSQIVATEPYVDALERLLDLVDAVEADGIALAHLDVGGGLGITYRDEAPPDAGALVERLLAHVDARGHGGKRVILEPGRSLVGNAGLLVSEVLYLKRGDERNFCIVDAAMNDLMRPAMYDAWMRIVECRRGAAQAATWDVVGPVCESGDWLGHGRELALAPGDFVAVLSAGAYAMSMASNYNTRPRPAEVLVAGSDAWLIRERETVAELMRGEHPLPAAARRTS
ncbi:MAG TPA: diaminopimelate decarboxylase [Caldimonas sp.]|nr:diaminopimelate decarboxylase [Caldimonas sp.]HEX4234121.1 diaminopimelate decarboxylase [Caldimonas sp.]